LPGPLLIAKAIAEYKSSVRLSTWREYAAFMDWLRPDATYRPCPGCVSTNMGTGNAFRNDSLLLFRDAGLDSTYQWLLHVLLPRVLLPNIPEAAQDIRRNFFNLNPNCNDVLAGHIQGN
jgi:hypothetical protein